MNAEVRKGEWPPAGTPVVLRGRQLFLRTKTSAEIFRARTAETKEPDTLDWLDRVLRPSDVFFDVGANIGLYSLYAALAHPSIRAVAFEPSVHTAATLGLNVLSNPAADVTVCPFAVGDGTGVAPFHLASAASGMSMHSLDHRHVEGFGNVPATVHMVGVFLLDNLGAYLPPPSVMKIDVDGCEERVLVGGRETIRHPRLRSVLVEVNRFDTLPSHEDAVRGVLAEAGLTLTSVGPEQRRGGAAWRNWIFDRAEADVL